MASEEFGDKTHEATPYRRQKAREEGQVVRSQDLASAALLVASLLVLWYFGGSLADTLGGVTRDLLGGEAWVSTDLQTSISHCVQLTWRMGLVLVPVLSLLMLVGVLTHIGQFGVLYLPERLAIDWQRINPLPNGQRIFSLSNWVQLAFGLLKVMLIFTVASWSVWGERDRLLNLANHPPNEIAVYLLQTMFWTSMKIGCALAALALFDYGYQYWKHEQDLRMTTQELKEEIKTQQGDPQIAARRKQVQRQMAMHRLSSTIPTADVIVTNPTELAVALQYDYEKMAAPVVIAKGAGVLAQRIRRLGLENNVPIVERKELARALYATVDIGQPVPAEQYAAVAEVVRYVYQLKGKKLPGAKAA
jgi:flagellar biosynthesis protein FlhB